MTIWLVLATLPAIFCEHNLKAGQRQVDEIDGKWELVSYENEGVKKLASDRQTTFHGQRILIKDNRWIEWYDGKDAPPADRETTKFICAKKAGMPFRYFDYWPVDDSKKPDRWKKIGIYKVDGDRLAICFRIQPIPGEKIKRPKAFDASKGTGTGLAIYKRIDAVAD